jgi:hypothetical protein
MPALAISPSVHRFWAIVRSRGKRLLQPGITGKERPWSIATKSLLLMHGGLSAAEVVCCSLRVNPF